MSIKGIASLAELMDDLPEAGAQEIELTLINPDPHQPRTSFDELRLEALAASLKAQGIIEPLMVWPIPRSPDVTCWWPGSAAGARPAWPG